MERQELTVDLRSDAGARCSYLVPNGGEARRLTLAASQAVSTAVPAVRGGR